VPGSEGKVAKSDGKDARPERRLLPLLLDLSSKRTVIFGGGSVGERKARLFSGYTQVKVVSLDFTPGLEEMGDDLELIHADLLQGFEKHLHGAFIVIPATSDPRLNQSIEIEASKRGILVNRVDGVGDVVVPSLIRKDPITIAISTESPALSKYIRLQLERELTGNYQAMAQLLSDIRPELRRSVSLQKERARIIWQILEDEVVWSLLDISYEKAYMRARSHVCLDERDSLDAGDTPQGLDRRN
jgi:precorrin-2 dehydrogenase/sirohydrochlorin ferrochelatase